jgi:hypothetical protein
MTYWLIYKPAPPGPPSHRERGPSLFAPCRLVGSSPANPIFCRGFIRATRITQQGIGTGRLPCPVTATIETKSNIKPYFYVAVFAISVVRRL